MTDWDDQLRQFRADFIRSGSDRLAELEGFIGALRRDALDGAALSELRRGFHRLAGAGSTFGLPRVSELGLAGEAEVERLLETGDAPDEADLERWRRLISDLQKAFAQGASAGGTNGFPVPLPPAGDRHDHPFSVVLVEDDPDFASTLLKVLEGHGMSARWARTLSEARSILAGDQPHALISDILLEDGSGYDLVRWFRQQPGGEGPPVLMVSVLSSFVDKVEAVHCGADGYFPKPVDWDDFVRYLVRLMERGRRQPSRILSVEDDPQESQYIKAILTSAGYEFRACPSPERFEAELSAFQPDLVLMDVVLPGADGFTLVKVMRQSEAHLTVPVIFLTAQNHLRDKISGLKAGGDDYLAKPVVPPLLLASVAAHLERARLLRGLVERDGLTGLLTHTAFFERAGAIFSQRTRPQRRPTALVMVDVDNFKEVNDRFGHPTGDRVLRGLSALFRRRLRQPDVLGRYGGEEFALVLEDLGEAEVTRLMERLQREFASVPHGAADGTEFYVTFSAGVALLVPEFPSLAAWTKAADVALYAAKAAGKNCVRVHGEAP